MAHRQPLPAAVEITAAAHLPTRHGRFLMETFRFGDDPTPHMALSVGLHPASHAPAPRSTAPNAAPQHAGPRPMGVQVPTVRIHSECVTSEIFGSLKCDCAEQLDSALAAIQTAGCGVVVYLRQEGRGIGLENKLKAYALQEHGLDTVEANLALDLPIDARDYGPALAYLHRRGVDRCTLLTNNPDKVAALESGGIDVIRTPLRASAHQHEACHAYLEAKRNRLGQDC